MEGPTVRQRKTLSNEKSMEGPTVRQRMTLSDQLSLLHSSNFRSKTLTLAAILEADKNSTGGGGGGRTLLDVIREEEESRGSSSRWRDLTDRLRIRSPATGTAGSAPTSSSADSSDGPIRVSLSTLMELREREEEERAAVLLTEVNGEEEDGDEGDVEEGKRGHVCRCCCVCMVRKKGAAFIPCGHTFCRVCSREMMANRGNCPLCNASILEVLDIF